MRRILATATLGLALFGAAACADTQPEASPSAGPSTATSAAAPAGVDKKTACANLTKAEADFKAAFMTVGPKLIDPAKQGEAVQEITKAATDFQAAYGKDVATIADAELKAAVEADLKVLGEALAKAATAGNDMAKFEAAFGPEFEKAGEKVKSLCAA